MRILPPLVKYTTTGEVRTGRTSTKICPDYANLHPSKRFGKTTWSPWLAAFDNQSQNQQDNGEYK